MNTKEDKAMHQAKVAKTLVPVVLMCLGWLSPPVPLATAQEASARDHHVQFPVKPIVFVDKKFSRSEGIAFNGEGGLYVTGDNALWRVSTEGKATKICDLYSNLGLAPIGDRDILVADFGPTNAFDHGKNDDGIVWRVTPEGERTKIIEKGIGDPNFILVFEDRSFLVSDDATNEIFHVASDGSLSLFTTAVDHPNGLVLSSDGKTLYVAQIFKGIRPIVIDNRVWALQLENGRPTGEPRVVAETGEFGANDGLAMDSRGRIYIAANGDSKIWRLDPATGKLEVIAKKMPGVASLAFGQGEFDHQSIYATSTRRGKVWQVPVGVTGAPLHR